MKRTHNKGQIIMAVVLLSLLLSIVVVLGITAPILRQVKISQNVLGSRESYYVSEGASEDIFYRMKNNVSVTFPYTLTLGNGTASSTSYTVGSGETDIVTDGNVASLIRRVDKDLTTTNGFSFNFGIQVGLGGLTMQNGSAVNGNVYSNGPVTGSGNTIHGSVVSTGSSGLISGVHATSSAYAHTISNSTIDGSAYYQTISNTTVAGTSHPGSTDQASASMPITDSLVSQWETQAAQGGQISSPCPYSITSNVSLGPIKINCGLNISGNGTTVTLTGPVWVVGNLSMSNSSTIKVVSTAGDVSIPIIMDNAASPTTSGTITMSNSTTFLGSGGADSYVMLVSQNTSAENSGATTAITIGNGAAGNLLVYAPHGSIILQNSVDLREVTGYKLTLQNNSVVDYTIGLAQSLFTSGPGGTWKIKRFKESH